VLARSGGGSAVFDLSDFNLPAAWAGLTTFLWYAVGMVPVQIAVIARSPRPLASVKLDVHHLGTGAVSSVALSFAYRQPLATTSSLSALIFLGTLAGRFGFDDIAAPD